MRMYNTIVSSTDIHSASNYLRNGDLVAVPTETVYGLSANGLNAKAVEEIYNVKGRPETKPISLLISGIKSAENFCSDIPEAAYRLAEAFWPGPLTMVLPKKEIVPSIVTAGGKTVGVRCPDHPITLELLKLVDFPLATPSANPSGKASPKSAQEVYDYFHEKIPMILDGGLCSVGIESTVLTFSGGGIKIFRQGALSLDEIERVSGLKVI